MPELGEVEYFRRQWHLACGETVRDVAVHPQSRVFRDCPAAGVRRELTGARLEDSRSHGKQLLFAFSGGRWLGLHMGMTGNLSAFGGESDSPEVRLRENHIDVRGTDKHDMK